MENNSNMEELEQMRCQLQLLRSKLEGQQIVNDKLVRRAVRKSMTWIRWLVYFEFMAIPFLALLWLGIKDFFGLSWYNYVFAMVMFLVDAVWDYRINVSKLRMAHMEQCSLMETMHNLVDMKRMRTRSFYTMTLLSIVWLVWTGIEMWMGLDGRIAAGHIIGYAARGGFCGFLLSIPLSIFVVVRIYRKMQRTNDELIQQIRELSDNQ